MSSAILYLAIVAIWACVLIPRWLRRDSARGAPAPVAAESLVPAEAGDGTPQDAEGPPERTRGRSQSRPAPRARSR